MINCHDRQLTDGYKPLFAFFRFGSFLGLVSVLVLVLVSVLTPILAPIPSFVFLFESLFSFIFLFTFLFHSSDALLHAVEPHGVSNVSIWSFCGFFNLKKVPRSRNLKFSYRTLRSSKLEPLRRAFVFRFSFLVRLESHRSSGLQGCLLRVGRKFWNFQGIAGKRLPQTVLEIVAVSS